MRRNLRLDLSRRLPLRPPQLTRALADPIDLLRECRVTPALAGGRNHT